MLSRKREALKSKLFQKLRRLRENQHGLAFMEFALALPAFLVFGLIGLEYTNVVLAYQKTERITSTVADQVAGNQIAPNERQIGDMFVAAEEIAKPFEFDPAGNVIITAVLGVMDNDTNTVKNKVVWQRCSIPDSFDSEIGEEWTDTPDIADGPDITLPQSLKLGQNQMAIVAEVFFPYKEIVSAKLVENSLPRNGIFREASIFRTRGSAIMNVTPVSGVTTNVC